MKKLVLSPKGIVTGDLTIGNFDKLNEYYDKIKNGDYSGIQPVTVISKDQYSFTSYYHSLVVRGLELPHSVFSDEIAIAKRFGQRLESLLKSEAEYILCDGNHRGLAFALNGLVIPSRQIETTDDLQEINEEFSQGGKKGPIIMRESTSIEGYLFKLYRAFSHSYSFITLEGLLEDLTRGKELKVTEEGLIYEPAVLPF